MLLFVVVYNRTHNQSNWQENKSACLSVRDGVTWMNESKAILFCTAICCLIHGSSLIKLGLLYRLASIQLKESITSNPTCHPYSILLTTIVCFSTSHFKKKGSSKLEFAHIDLLLNENVDHAFFFGKKAIFLFWFTSLCSQEIKMFFIHVWDASTFRKRFDQAAMKMKCISRKFLESCTR